MFNPLTRRPIAWVVVVALACAAAVSELRARDVSRRLASVEKALSQIEAAGGSLAQQIAMLQLSAPSRESDVIVDPRVPGALQRIGPLCEVNELRLAATSDGCRVIGRIRYRGKAIRKNVQVTIRLLDLELRPIAYAQGVLPLAQPAEFTSFAFDIPTTKRPVDIARVQLSPNEETGSTEILY